MDQADCAARNWSADAIRRQRRWAKEHGHDLPPVTVSRPTQQHGYLFHAICRRCGKSLVIEYTAPDRPVEVRGTMERTGQTDCVAKSGASPQ